MIYQVLLAKTATDDLAELSQWIEAAAGGATADAYEARVRTFLRTLTYFPARGTPHDELEPGLRSITFERRLRIAYRIVGDTVEVVRIFNGARDVRLLFDS